ncbi:MAG: restriction endonuclease subunit S [Eggerthella sp.]|nr:restriction endonuclease subunit S [Eggerthella sp.]
MTSKPQFGGEKVKLSDLCSKGKSSLRQKDLLNDGPYLVYGASGVIGTMSCYQNEEPYVAVVKDGAGVGRVMACKGKSSVLGTMQALLPSKNVDLNYLLHLVRSLKLGDDFSGSTIPHIYFRDYGEREVPAIAIKQQIMIAGVLDKIEMMLARLDMTLKKQDQLVKSRFVEMFGAVNELRPGFTIKTINDVCSSIIRGPFGSALKKSFFVSKGEATYKVYEQKHAIQKRADIGTYYITSEKFDSLKRFECKPGDILMSCSGTMGKLYQLPINCEPGIINQALCKFTLNESVLPDYFFRVMEQIIDELGAKGSGIKNVSSVKYIKAIKIPVPPLFLQQQFADFVAQVDKSGFAVRQQIEKLQMLYDSLAQEYFGD